MRFYRFIILLITLLQHGFVTSAPALAESSDHSNLSVFSRAQAIPCNQDMMVTREWGVEAIRACRKLSTLITQGNARLLGFERLEDVSKVQVGTPFDLYTIGLDALRNYQPGDPVDRMVKTLESRLYPLSIMEQNGAAVVRSSLLISTDVHAENRQTFSGVGLKKLITLVTKYRMAQPAFSFIVWIPSLNLHFLGDNRDETMRLLPLATRKLYGLEEGKAISATVVFALLAQQARAHDESNPG